MFILDGCPIILTSNIDGYIPLKFQSGKTYEMSCNAASQRETVQSTGLSPRASQAPIAVLQSPEPQLTRTQALKAIIQSDKSGNALERLRTIAAEKKKQETNSPPSEPIKPPRRSNSRQRMEGSDSIHSNQSSGSIVDVTYAL